MAVVIVCASCFLRKTYLRKQCYSQTITTFACVLSTNFTNSQETKKSNFMKFCSRCEKTTLRFYLTRYCHESDGRFQTLLKPVYGTFDDGCNNIASYFYALIKFSFPVY